MNKQKLLFISPIPPPFGGIAVLSQSILKSGLTDYYHVIQLNTATKSLREKIDSVRITGVFNGLKNHILLFRLCLKNRDVKYAYITGTCNLAITRDIMYIFILRLFKIEVLFNIHGTRKLDKSNFWIKAISRKAMWVSKFVLSPTLIDYEAAKKLIEPQSKVRLFYNSTKIQLSLPDLNIKNNESKVLKIIGIGRLSDAKGAYDLINVCIELINEGADIKLSWIGRGAYKEDDKKAESILKNQSLEVRKNIILLKDLTEEEKYFHLAQSDIFILPTKNDNLPVSILEAMALGLPVISTYMGAIPEVIKENRNGWLINHSSHSELKGIILKVKNEKHRFPIIAENNRVDFSNIYDSSNRVKELVLLTNPGCEN